MKFSKRARWSENPRRPDPDEADNSKTFRGRTVSRRFRSVYPVHLGG